MNLKQLEEDYLYDVKDIISYIEEVGNLNEEQIAGIYFDISELKSSRRKIDKTGLEPDEDFLTKEYQLLTKLEELLKPYEKLHKYFLKLFHQYLPTTV